jgi:Zn-dependent protease
MFTLNLALFVFNLLPLPPLDGSALPPLILDEGTSRRYLDLVRSPAFSLIGLVVAWKVFPWIFGPIFAMAYLVLFYF